MRKIAMAASLLLLGMILWHCSGNVVDSRREPPRELTAAEKELVSAGNSFGLKLFREVVSQEEPDTNIFISPLSVSVALGMAYNGAAGQTREEIQEVIELAGLSVAEVNQAYKSLIYLLTHLDPKVIFEIANSVWYRQGLPVEEEFLSLNRDYFNAEVYEADFNNPATVDLINGWVDDKTHGKIDEIVKELDPMLMMILINAIYFKGDWTYQFDKDLTVDDRFRLIDGSLADCKMMVQADSFLYYENDRFKAIDLPYGDGQFSMTIFLPKLNDIATDADNLIASMTEDNYRTWLGAMETREADVYLPKFTVEYEILLNKVLQALGMKKAFVSGAADFSNIVKVIDLFISRVVHKTYVKVDEEGTEAAAVTAIFFETSSMPPGRVEMRVDRPFVFVIREHKSETILFTGRIVDPGIPE